jgi:hypothetical protein
MNSIHTTRLFAGMAGLAFAAAVGFPAYAQTDSQPASRAEVKEQTRAANKAGQMPAGEEDASKQQMPSTPSTKTREQRMAETREANRNGGLGSPGQSLYKANNTSQRDALAKSTKTKAEGKSETMAAVKDKKMMPAGEAEQVKK